MNSNKLLHKYQHYFKKIPLFYKILGGVGILAIVAYSLIFFIPKTVEFSYSGETCVGQLMIAPDSQKESSDKFSFTATNPIKIGDVTVVSTGICFEPKTSPSAGVHAVSVSPFGGPIAAKQYQIKVEDTPVAHTSELAGKEISTATPLEIKLSQTDTIHQYKLAFGEKNVDCQSKLDAINCEVEPLELKQGQEYDASLERSFNGDNKQQIFSGKVSTLLPLKLKKASIKNKQVIYDIPTEFKFTFDRPLQDATVWLINSAKEELKVEKTIEKSTLKVQLPKNMPRSADYTLNLKQAIGDNGSSLSEAINLKFTLSGGPKVSGVSIGASHVPQTANVIITFDQPIDEANDLTEFIKVKGVNASIQRVAKNKVSVAISGAKQCSDFSISVGKGIKSAVNNESGNKAWQYSSRIICGTSSVIGYSVQGRPIVAHYFGSGDSTILFTAAIHGSEPSSYSTMMGWVNYLQANANKIPANKRVVVVPNLNPDGIASGSRNNANNVNLGRNYPTANWRADIDTANGLLKNGGGKTAGSEPETKALLSLTRQLKPRLEVSFHAQGSLVGANKYSDSVAIGNVYAGIVGYQTMFYNAEDVMGYSMTGEYEDWMGEELGIPAILIELPAQSGNYINSQLPALLRILTV